MITIVAGPPCSGKTHYVREHAGPSDLVIDWDEIAIALGSPNTHIHPRRMYDAIEAEYDRLLALAPTWPADVWIIRGLPDPTERAEWVSRYDACLVICDADIATLRARARERDYSARTMRAIGLWRLRARVTDQGGGSRT